MVEPQRLPPESTTRSCQGFLLVLLHPDHHLLHGGGITHGRKNEQVEKMRDRCHSAVSPLLLISCSLGMGHSPAQEHNTSNARLLYQKLSSYEGRPGLVKPILYTDWAVYIRREAFSDQGSGRYTGAHACDLPSLISQLVFSSGFNLKDSFVSKTSHEIVVTIC